VSCVAGEPTVLVAGASGYAGALAARLIDRHPHFALEAVTSRSDVGRTLDDLYPHHRVALTLDALDLERQGDVAAAIVAYPHGASAPVVAELHERGVRVVDLSADFRLHDLGLYNEWYGEHGAPGLLDHSVYGLPELHRDAIREAHVVANPGCFPTAALIALAPLARAGLIADAIVDVKTGVSGAGRAATDRTHFVAVDENVTPYNVGVHRHAPEIDQELALLGAHVTTTVVPHLLPLAQGELVTCYVTPSRAVDQGELDALIGDAYADEPFVEVAGDRPPGVREVRDTNLCRVHAVSAPRTGKLVVITVLDNLWKGAASQAVQNLNLMFGFDETAGLEA